MDNTDPYKTKFKEERLYMSTNQNLMQHMRELIDRIKAADVAYYRDDNPTMTDREYDLLVDELKELEITTGLILSGSPTQTVSGEILKELTPVRHTKPMLSADKTKSVDEMLQFANGRPVVLSWKLDGLTLVLRYEGGEFKQAITRGREGIIGEDVTHTVRTFMNVPMCIPCTDKFEVRGEGVISWAHFEKINLSLSEPYSHPRNLAAGSVRMLDARESGKRYLEFFAFDLISDSIEEQSKATQLQFLAENGFDVVPYVYTDTHDADELRELITDFKPAEYGYPVDGVIMEYDNLVYGRSLGATGHHENRLMALKWEDELYETECTGLDVAVTRTGMVSLTATFKPVEIDGTMVSRAYVHNFTIYKNLALGIGDKLMVYKANKIIPQIAENRTKSGELDYPHTCPCCGSRLTFHTLPGGSKQLFCENPSCAAKLVQKFDHFCEKTRMNIECMPTVEEDPHENAAVVQSIELLQDQKKEQAKNIMAEITLCSLMGRTTSFARQLVAAVEEVMAPYSAEASEEYMEFADMTEELKSDYAKSIDCLKLPNGKIVECGSYPYFSKYSIVDGKVSQNKVGPLHHTRRTKQSRKIQYLPNCPRQKLYKTFEKYAGDYRGYEYNEEEKGYGFYCNPNAMWDWYQIGGRWPVSFLVKTDCTEYSFGERSWGNYSKKYPAPEGYMWVSAARKKDICWDVMQNWYTVQDTERYNKFKEAFQTGKLPDGYYGKIQENGIFYCGECTYAADETLDEYLARVGIPKSWKYPIGVSDIVDADEWLSKNDINIGKESNSWHEQIDTYIDDLDGEDVLVSVDYHI